MKPLKLIFMGTPAFALPSLDLLYLSTHKIEALVLPPDRPCGRGGRVIYAPTKKWALKHNLELVQPEQLSENSFMTWLKAKQPDLIVTVAFGRLLSTAILKLPALGCINLHASYLPAYRGAAPIHRAVIDGARFSGVSVIEMTPELDAGDIFMQEKVELSPFDTAGMLHDRLAVRGASLLTGTIDALAAGNANKTSQDNTLATYAPPLTTEDECIDWSCKAIDIYNRIRGLNPWPGAYTIYDGKRLKVWRALYPEQAGKEITQKPPGTILAVGKDSMTVSTGEGTLTLLDIQPAGKKVMDAGSFCCGYRIEPGIRLCGDQGR